MKRVFIIIAAFAALILLVECKVNEGDIKGGLPYLSVSLTNTTLSKSKCSVDIPIETNRPLSFEVVSDEIAWLTVDQVDNTCIRLVATENFGEQSRTALVKISTTNNLQMAELTVTQDASGELTYKGDLILRNKAEVASNTYTKASGFVIVGNVVSMQTVNPGSASAASAVETVQVEDKIISAEPSDIDDVAMDSISSKINEIHSGVLVVVNTEATQFPLEMIRENDVHKVYFAHNDMTYLPSAEEMAALELTELSIAGNDVSDISPLEGCETITHLDISDTDVTDLSAIASLSNLEELSLQGVAVTGPQVEILQEYIPDCVIDTVGIKPSESPLPEVAITSVEELSANSFRITATVTNKGEELPSKVGFYIGIKKVLSQMQFVEASYSVEDNSFSYEYTGEDLTSAVYYFRASVSNSKGEGYSAVGFVGKRINKGDIFITSEEEMEMFYEDNISHIEGSLFIGNRSEDPNSGGIRLDVGGESRYFRKSSISSLNNLKNLVSVKGGIYILNTDVASIAPIMGIQDVETIWVKGNKIGTIPTLSHMTTLKTLNISRNSISDFAPVLGSSVENLYLGDNDSPQQETNLIGILDGLEKMSNLKTLDLSGLPIHSWQVDEIREKLSGCDIIFISGGRTPYLPDVSVAGYTPSDGKVLLKGKVSYNQQYPVTEYGFYYGKDMSSLTKVKADGEDNYGKVNFQSEISIPDADNYIYLSYAVNDFGEQRSKGSRTFTLSTIDLSAKGTANCYIVSTPWKHRFKCTVKGNSDEPVGDIASVEVIWETKNTDESVTKGEIIKSVALVDDYIELYPSDELTPGNALIAVKDALGNILWSWHIWVADYDPQSTAQTYYSGAIAMDRNLGALNVTMGDVRANGLFYQWGRKDPFPAFADMEQTSMARTYPENVVEKTKSAGSYGYSILYPYKMIVDTFDWNRSDSLWMSNKTKYDPCPPGWKIPDGNTSVWAKFNIGPEIHYNKGVNINVAYSNPRAFFPTTGYMDCYGEKGYLTLCSYHWSATTSGKVSAYTLESSSYSNGSVQLYSARNRSDFSNVRCVKDEALEIKTVEIKDITDTKAVLVGELAVQMANITSKGFVVSTTSGAPTVHDAEIKLVLGNSSGRYEAEIVGLEYNKTYYVRAYVSGESGTRYGETLSFTTKKAGNGEGYTEDDYEW